MRRPRVDSATVPAVDWAKALAMIAVLVMHAGPFGLPGAGLDSFVRITCTSFHVPVFLMVSGYLHATATPLSLGRAWMRLRRVLGPYCVASLAITAFGLTPYATWAALPWNLAVGQAHGIYYYVFVWCGCVLTGLVWSRLRNSNLLLALALVVLATEWRTWNPTLSFFWGIRDPLLQGWWFCYLGGWCARRFGWLDVVRHYRAASVAFAVAGSVPWLARLTTGMATDLRMLYSTSVVVAIVALARTAPFPIRWVSSETLWIYLGHITVIPLFLGYAYGWSPLPRIAFTVSLTLGACAVAIMLGRGLQASATKGLAIHDARRGLPEHEEASGRRASLPTAPSRN